VFPSSLSEFGVVRVFRFGGHEVDMTSVQEDQDHFAAFSTGDAPPGLTRTSIRTHLHPHTTALSAMKVRSFSSNHPAVLSCVVSLWKVGVAACQLLLYPPNPSYAHPAATLLPNGAPTRLHPWIFAGWEKRGGLRTVVVVPRKQNTKRWHGMPIFGLFKNRRRAIGNVRVNHRLSLVSGRENGKTAER